MKVRFRSGESGAMPTGTQHQVAERSVSERPSVALTSDGVLDEAVRRVLSAGSPELVVLFGSHARGDARPDSDLDLLIVEESSLPRYRRAPRYLRALAGLNIAKDVVVWTPDEIAAWRGVPDAFITTAMREGRTLYARPAGQ